MSRRQVIGRRPRNKANVEQAVLIVERWLLGRRRHRTFYSLADVNAAIAALMMHLAIYGGCGSRCSAQKRSRKLGRQPRRLS